MTINLGDRVKDSVTGFEGTVIGRTRWFTGCDTIIIQPDVDKDGKLPDTHSFDIKRVVLVKARKEPKPGPALAG